MSSSPEQSTPQTTSLNISRGISDVSILSTASLGSGGESPPRHGHTLSPPQLLNVMGASSSSTPNSPHLGRPTSGNLVKGMRRKFMRKGAAQATHSSQNPPPTVQEDPLDTSDHQANKALFVRMLKSWQLQPKKIKNFRRAKRRPDKQYHSDDGYTSDPGVLREEEDDETDNDPSPDELRRISQIQELERKAAKIRRSIADEDDTLLQENDEDLSDKPSQHKLVFKLNRSSIKSKSFYDHQRQKLEKLESQLKELREGGSLDSRGARIRGRIEGGLRGMSLGLKGRLTHAGSKFRRKRIAGAVQEDEEVIDDEEEDEDDDGQGGEVIITGTSTEQELALLKVDMDALRLVSEESLEQNKKWKEDILDQNERLGDSLALFMEKLEQERERGDRLEGQLNDITELHQHAVDNLRTQLTQIEHTTTNKCQDLEDLVDDFQSKFDHIDAHVHKLMDTSEAPQVNHMVRKPMASLLSFLLVLLAFLLKLISIIRNKPLLKVSVVLVLIAMALYYTIS